jgi:hypothetical protein
VNILKLSVSSTPRTLNLPLAWFLWHPHLFGNLQIATAVLAFCDSRSTYMLQKTATAESTLSLRYELYYQGILFWLQTWLTIVHFLLITFGIGVKVKTIWNTIYKCVNLWLQFPIHIYGAVCNQFLVTFVLYNVWTIYFYTYYQLFRSLYVFL